MLSLSACRGVRTLAQVRFVAPSLRCNSLQGSRQAVARASSEAAEQAVDATVAEPLPTGDLDLRVGKILSVEKHPEADTLYVCLLYTSPSPRDRQKSRMPSSA